MVGTTQRIPAAPPRTHGAITEAQAFLGAAVSSLLFSFLVDAGGGCGAGASPSSPPWAKHGVLGGGRAHSAPHPAFSLASVPITTSRVLSAPGLSFHPIALGSSYPRVHAEMGTHPAPNTQGMGSSLPTKRCRGKLVLYKDLKVQAHQGEPSHRQSGTRGNSPALPKPTVLPAAQ